MSQVFFTVAKLQSWVQALSAGGLARRLYEALRAHSP